MKLRINKVFNCLAKKRKSGLRFFLLLTFYLPALYPAAVSGSIEKNLLVKQDSILKNKLFYLFTLLDSDPALQQTIKRNKVLEEINSNTSLRINNSGSGSQGKCYAQALKWDEKEIKDAGTMLIRSIDKSEKVGWLVSELKQSGHFAIYHELNDTAFVRKAWESTAYGINRIFDVYLAGIPPKRYAAIDSISFKQDDPVFVSRIDSAVSSLLHQKTPVFYDIPLNAALAVLKINGRDEAARYEPLTGGYNAKAFEKAKNTNWERYKYSVILIPGFGPEKPGVKLHSKGIERCRMAAERFKNGLAPFIIVSGGHVYPFRTPYSEAVEMRRFLMEELNIPENAIIIEPHARHTTTNIRNASRLIYRFHIPDSKPGLVVTDAAQTNMIANLDARCMRELGYVPYKGVNVLNENEVEFYVSKQVFQINLEDPLDP